MVEGSGLAKGDVVLCDVAREAANDVMVVAAADASFVATLAFRITGIAPDAYDIADRRLTAFISRPDGMAAVVAVLAGIVGMLSLTEGRSGALIGVLVSVTTIPAIGNIGAAAAYRSWDDRPSVALRYGMATGSPPASSTASPWPLSAGCSHSNQTTLPPLASSSSPTREASERTRPSPRPVGDVLAGRGLWWRRSRKASVAAWWLWTSIRTTGPSRTVMATALPT